MRIRLLLLACLILPRLAMAAVTDVDQQGAWTLRTSTSTQMTKDYFCASEAKFTHDFTFVLAHNILGQTSLILNWPGLNSSVGTIVPVRISIDQIPLRDARASLKASGMLVVPLGWDDDTLNKLAAARHVTFETNNMNVHYNMKDNSKAFARLNSCTASLIDRLPDTASLSPDVSQLLHKSGFDDAKTIQVSNNKNHTENFLVNGIFGGTAELTGGGADVTQRMLEYVDQLELICRARFSSELGAPTPVPGGEITTAEAKCDAPHTGTITALVFVNRSGKARVYYFEGDKDRADRVKALRDGVVKNLQ